MAALISVVAIVTLIVTLASTIAAIWMQHPSAAQFLQLTTLVLSWKVVAGGLAIGAASGFGREIKAAIAKLGR